MGGKTLTLAELAELTNSKLIGDPNHMIREVADLSSATQNEASFLSNPRYTPTRYESAMKGSKAGVIYIAPSVSPIEGRNFLVSEDPTHAFQKTIEAIRGGTPKFTAFSAVHASAVIHETATLGENVSVGPNAVIDGQTIIKDNTTIGAGVYIGAQTIIGVDCIIYPNVTIREQCNIGNRVIIQPGAVIGGCGFGYATSEKGEHTKLNHVGNVVIEDDVEIGANSTIDRARFTTTHIGAGTKIDNLVTVAHNVKLGNNNLIAGQVGIAGSVETGHCVVMAGQSAVAGHLKVGSGVILSGKGGITKSIDTPGVYGGVPAIPMKEFNKQQVLLRQIDKHVTKLKELDQRLDTLERSGILE